MTCPRCHAPLGAGSSCCPRCGMSDTRSRATRLMRWSLIINLVGWLVIALAIASGFALVKATVPQARDVGVLMVFGLSGLWVLLGIGLGSFVSFVGGLLGIWAYARDRKRPVRRPSRWLLALAIILGFAPDPIAVVALVWGLFVSPRTPRVGVETTTSEARVVARLDSVVRAETAYTRHNGGYFGPLVCLPSPWQCLPSYSGPPFLDRDATSTQLSGYRLDFYGGPEVENASAYSAAPGSLTRFTYVATPIRLGKTGLVAFCADGGGGIRLYKKGASPTKGADNRCADHGIDARALFQPPRPPQPKPGTMEENEAAITADMRLVLAAERAYSKVNGGCFDNVGCLARPGTCLHRYDGPGFLDDVLLPRGSDIVSLRHAYISHLRQTGPRLGVWNPCRSRSSMRGFVYVALPQTGSLGKRAFCATEAGSICAFPSSERFMPASQSCPDSCAPVTTVAMP
jgi:hypothetical protein